MAQQEGKAGGGDKAKEVRSATTEAVSRMTVREFFNQNPHPFSLSGYVLEQEELAGRPKTPEEAAKRAARWRVLHLIHHLGISPTEADMVAAYGSAGSFTIGVPPGEPSMTLTLDDILTPRSDAPPVPAPERPATPPLPES